MSYNPFGGRMDDPTGFANTNLILQEPTEEVDPLERADAEDENGDIAASTWHGNSGGALKTVNVVLLLKSGTLDLSTLYCGEKAAGTVIESLAVDTDNGDWPKITAVCKIGTQAITAPTGKTNKFSLPAITITGAKRAQEMGFTTDATCRLTGSSLSASVDLARVNDSLGEAAAHGLSSKVIEVSADFVAVTTAPGWTVTGDFVETQPPTRAENQAAYHTGTGTAEMVFERDSAGE